MNDMIHSGAERSAAPLLAVDGISGGYSLNRPVLHDVTFTVEAGEMVALIGLNGAGKSTTMKHILGLLAPHRGAVRIRGYSLAEAPDTYRSSYAFVPETPLLYEELTVYEHLELVARAYDLERMTFERRAERLLHTFRMEHAKRLFSAHLSKGMKQKVMIMSAFLAEPSLYIIDEPFLGLDPFAIRSVLELMAEKRREGAGILVSSHMLSMIDKYSDRFVIMHEGRVLEAGDLQQIAKRIDAPGASLEDVFFRLIESGADR